MKQICMMYYDLNRLKTVMINDDNQIIYSDLKPRRLIKQWCIQNGSTYKGAIESFSILCNAKRKIPICVSIYFRVLFIPTIAESNDECIYLQYDKIKSIHSCKGVCSVEFKNGQLYEINCSSRTLKKQMDRCSMFLDRVTSYPFLS